MKKIKVPILILIFALCLGSLFSCNNEDPSSFLSSSSSEGGLSNNEESSSSMAPSQNLQAPNETKTQIKQTEKYYRQISSEYSRTVVVLSNIHQDGRVFSDGFFVMNGQSQYKILSSHSELQAFSLLNCDEVETSLFEENCVVAILRYYEGSSVDSKRESGFYNANFTANDGAKIELDLYHAENDSTDDTARIYTLYFVVVPKGELEGAELTGTVTINEVQFNQYNTFTYKLKTTTQNTEAYFVADRESKEKVKILDEARLLPQSYPYIAIHLEKPIETDFIVNGFKYENGYIYITLQIFERMEMSANTLESNLIIVSLAPHSLDFNYDLNIPDDIPKNCSINIVFEQLN